MLLKATIINHTCFLTAVFLYAFQMHYNIDFDFAKDVLPFVFSLLNFSGFEKCAVRARERALAEPLLGKQGMTRFASQAPEGSCWEKKRPPVQLLRCKLRNIPLLPLGHKHLSILLSDATVR